MTVKAAAATVHPSTIETWGPEVIGALIGALTAGLIALWVTRAELAGQRKADLATTRRAAFGAFLDAIGRLAEVWPYPGDEMRSAHLAATRAQQIWSMHLEPADAEVADWIYTIEGKMLDAMKAVKERHESRGMNAQVLAFFAEDEGGGNTLFQGLHTHGVEWHREGGDRAAARAWFEDHGADQSSSSGADS